MILSEAIMSKVFMVYAGFWLVVLTVLFLGVGALIKRYDKGSHGR